MEEVKMGDPMKEEVELGPLSRKDLRDNVHESVQKAVKDGAKLLTGGNIPQNMKGFFYPPTVLADVTTDNTAFKEEIFGPVASVMKVSQLVLETLQ
jgi:succinate-semialdehyde dehydrogenase/glutarate-semialdehyde dehydrogenase